MLNCNRKIETVENVTFREKNIFAVIFIIQGANRCSV